MPGWGKRRDLRTRRAFAFACGGALAVAFLAGAFMAGALGKASGATPLDDTTTTPATTPAPPPTTPAVTTPPTPDAAPPKPAPAPKPRPRPQPVPHRSTSSPSSSSVAHTPAVHVATRPAVHRAQPARHKTKRPKHRVHPKKRAKRHVHAKKRAHTKKITVPVPSQGASQALFPASSAKTTGKGFRIVLIGLLGLSLIPLGLAGAPVALVRPARLAWIIATRRTNITLFGILLMAAAAIAYLWRSHS